MNNILKSIKLSCLFLIITILCVFNFSCNKNKKEDNITLYPECNTSSKLVYVVNTSSFSSQEMEMIVSLQGIVAKKTPQIFLEDDEDSINWINYYQSQYGLKLINVSNVWELVNTFKSYIKDSKYVLYSSYYDKNTKTQDQTINYATTISGMEDYIMISNDLEQIAKNNGLILGYDVRFETTESIFNKYKDQLNKKVIIHQRPDKWELRDYAIAQQAICFYGDYYDGNSDIKNTILDWANDNVPILGWTENEVNYVSANSLQNKITLASDWSTNLSYTSGLPKNLEYNQRVSKNKITADNTKHYVAIVMSDGDNLQWMENGFATDNKYYGSVYRGEYKMTWGITPSLYDLEPGILNYLYENQTDNDYFIAGPSGAGYVNMTEYTDIKSYAKITNEYMAKCDLEYVNLIDNMIDTDKLDILAQEDNIKGGIWSVGNYYIEGAGGVYFANDKPFVTVRETLWRDNNATSNNEFYGFVERVAQRVNNYKVDPSSIEGYTVVIAHAWSIGTMEYINRFVEQLDDHVELVTVSELLDLVSENVEHENVEELDDIHPEDIKDLAEIRSEQYTIKDYNKINVDSTRVFNYADKIGKMAYKWKFGCGGLEYDFAGFSSEGVKLDGSDFEDNIDPLPNAWMNNKFNLTEEDKCLTIFAAHSANCDVNYRVRILYVENNILVSNILPSMSYEKDNNQFGWYKMDNSSPFVYYYDLTPFIGKEVMISIEQDDTGDGSGEVIFISKIVVSSEFDNGSNLSKWNLSDLSAYFNISGKVAKHTEGLCLEGKDAKIYGTITVKSNTLNIYMRKFERPINEQQDVSGFVIVRFNNEIVYVKQAVSEYIEVGNIEEFGYYSYDMSNYVGETGTLEIIFIEVNNVIGEHACISMMEFN